MARVIDEVDRLLTELEQSESVFARKYLEMREMESKPGHPLSVEDSKANAVLYLIENEIPLPEVIRFRLHRALNIERAVES